MGSQEWETARIQQGRPAASELTEDHIPLEAGLYPCSVPEQGLLYGARDPGQSTQAECCEAAPAGTAV